MFAPTIYGCNVPLLQCAIIVYRKTKIPRRGCRRLVRRDAALFSPLDWGVRLSGEHAAGERCSPLQYPPVTYGDIPLFKGDERLLRPNGHLLYERRLSGERCSPLRYMVATRHHRVPENKNPPEGGTGGCCRRKKNRFSPLNRGVRLSSEHAAERR